jgi:hypothetical protein
MAPDAWGETAIFGVRLGGYYYAGKVAGQEVVE